MIGLIETMRARGGRLPWLARHVARLRASLAALGAPEPPGDVVDLVRFAIGSGERGDRVVRLQLTVGGGPAEITTRDVNVEPAISLVLAKRVYTPYPHKTTEREQFGQALASARRVGATDALLVTKDGYVAEGTAWSLFWWENGALCTPALDLGILPGLGRARVMELAPATEMHAPATALKGRSLFLVNAVRGVVEIAAFEGRPVPRDARTAELAAAFWPD